MIKDWYRRRSDEVQTAFDVVREYLEQRPRDEWRRPDFDLLSGKLRLLGESERGISFCKHRPRASCV